MEAEEAPTPFSNDADFYIDFQIERTRLESTIGLMPDSPFRLAGATGDGDVVRSQGLNADLCGAALGETLAEALSAELTIDGDKYFMRVEMNLTWESVRDATYDTEVVCDDASLTVNSNASASGCTDVGAAAGLPLTNKFEAECTINDDEDELRCDPEGSTDKVVYKRRE